MKHSSDHPSNHSSWIAPSLMPSQSAIFCEFDRQCMHQALALAALGQYTARPNPAVGCVLTQGQTVVATGAHRKAGTAHAEVQALQHAQDSGVCVQGATAYVTLEPCAHFGKTPPCALALSEAGVRRVVVAMCDPNPQVAGEGVAIMRRNGIVVEVGLLAEQAAQLNHNFFYAMRHQIPYVITKIAMSLDAKTAMANGESRWITGDQARTQVHHLRAQHAVLLTGVGTVLADDPALTVRLDTAQKKALGWLPDVFEADQVHPMRVILDPRLRVPASAKIGQQPGQTVIVTCASVYQARSTTVASLQSAGFEVVPFACEQVGAQPRFDLKAVLAWLHQAYQARSVMVEAGATLNGALIEAGLINEYHVFIAPVLMGSQAKGMAHLPGLVEMTQRLALTWQQVQPIGQDMYGILKGDVLKGDVLKGDDEPTPK